MGLLACFPRPRRIALGGGTWLASELRLVDLARLEGWAADRLGDPLDGLDGLDPAGRRARLRAAYDRAERGGVGLSDPEADRLVFGTDAGLAEFLAVALRDDPRATPEAVAALALGLTARQWAAVERVAFAADPLEAAEAAIDREIGVVLPPPQGPGRAAVPWPVAVVEACRMLRATPAEVGELTIGQLRLLRAGGKAGFEPGQKPRGMSWEDFDVEQAKRKAFWKEGEG